MLVIALDTATTDLVAGIVDGDRVLAQTCVATRAHNERLMPEITGLLQQANVKFADLGAVVVGCGPGPFTGLRVGMATASALGQALGIPVHGVCTHDAVAAELNGDALVVTDARRREVYWARYAKGARVAGPDVCKPADLESPAVDVVSVPEQLAQLLPVDAPSVTYQPPTPAGLVAAADLAAEPEPLVPLYLRRPDAVPPKQAPKSPALP
ncbi:tRNA (adenosine(37)-N6)-threonylcarbamoyltransferase complex dimerization subunit type 1 TsaB [Corynebacterium fournieri]|uniref:tRNA (adenosine(37)-N6)-threonylcarbamoyltransferase complex dimerization subunit type 1 TsaB n=1 Tax=Corynebacterium fournieri TaxID=1852390 RepID=UPI000A2F35D8|nr:tRNA (adenosine(37)-N6)-threonylcarbamoyltransferase complex dimerization subunit type 1 TsaB [Corynebacterium fournieri]WJY96839.1 tRNA threonylcarbamoyladenosine biosynthesis protein TsaB [Corynebacterium fournieri]